MKSPLRAALAGLAVLVVASLAVPQPAAHASPVKAGAPQLVTDAFTVTLVTGDKVTVTSGAGKHGVLVTPAKGRENTRFVTRKLNGGLSVIPVDALPLIAADKLDSRLFDVLLLQKWGYDDAHTSELPLITTAPAGTRSAPRALAGSRSVRSLPELGLSSVRTAKRDAAGFWTSFTTASRGLRPTVGKLWLVGKLQPTLDVSVPQVGAPEAWADGNTGKGATVAVLDTGIDENHPDLKGVVTDSKDFTDSPVGITDQVGHGTHVASTIAGRGTASAGKYTGVAKEASLLIGKVCGGVGCDEDAILFGMQWAVFSGARIVSMSLGATQYDTPSILETAVNYYSKANDVLFVVAAGNGGGPETISSPGTADEALTVGSVDKGTEDLSYFSSQGPRVTISRRFDYGLKPDITAPGGGIIAAHAEGTPGDGPYVEMSGTSMATPHVAGGAAILSAEHPDWSMAEVKAALMSTAKNNPALSVYQQGAGRLDVGKASRATVTATGSLSMGYFPWPNADAPTVSKTITYTNRGSAPVTLDVSVVATDANHKPAAAGLFTTSAPTVTVPAGASAPLTVAVHPAAGSAGLYSGLVSARSADGSVALQTAIGAYKEPESYNINFLHLTRSDRGTLTEVLIVNRQTGKFYFNYLDSSPASITRLPAGSYAVHAATFETQGGPGDAAGTILEAHNVNLTRAQEVVLDDRKANVISMKSDTDTDTAVVHSIATDMNVAAAGRNLGITYRDLDGRLLIVPGAENVPSFSYGITATLIKAGSAWQGNPSGPPSPYTYNFAIPGSGKYPANPAYVSTAANSATVTQSIHRQGAEEGRQTYHQLFTPAAGDFAVAFTVGLGDLTTRTDRFMTPPGATASTGMVTGTKQPNGSSGFEQILNNQRRRYLPGTQLTEQWNGAVFGPSFSSTGDAPARTGDAISGYVWAFSDQAHPGGDYQSNGTAELSKDGNVIWQSKTRGAIAAKVPGDAGDYRLALTVNRDHAWSSFAQQISAVWTFHSEHPADTTPVVLPLQAVRFRPLLDADNTAPAGAFTVPLRVDRAPGSAEGTAKTVSVDASYDGGKTWTAVKVTGSANARTVHLTNPAGGAVSLRATVVDTAGNGVVQTTIGAYLVR
jgi:subtilisin family serine protease